ncbi:uncharacterized protein I303_106934 [Kwoniella dejecticola CBS 10117]|uniref:Aldehyde dehydrogenase domain-containing protein n=1 Tax=Kwoniella dejecticola CBS 10117 TaxID=1296121 RepID=A0AAJ8MJT4_9TREE
MIVKNLISCEPQEEASVPLTFDVVHPANQKVVFQVERSSTESCAKAVENCQRAFTSWKVSPLDHRCAIVEEAARLIEDESSGWAARLAAANIQETSSTKWWTEFQLKDVTGFMRELIQACKEVIQSQTIAGHNAEIIVDREPFGVCLAIAAWNAVHLLTARAIITPLLAGNTVVLKSSEHTPYTQRLWGELLYAAGLPPGCLSVVHVAKEDASDLVSQLLADKRIRHLNFTGSTAVGSILASLAGKHLKPTLMELGGKAPVLLLPDADLVTASSHIILGSFLNAGQICMSTERVLVAKSRYRELVAAIQETWTNTSVSETPALFSSSSAERVKSLIRDARQKGASSVIGNDMESLSGSYVSRTILGPAQNDMEIYREETFGPVSIIVTIDDESKSNDEVIDEMIELANDTDFGLTASVWSRNPVRALGVARQLECGAVHINAPTAADVPKVPHGGWKASGWGRFNGVEGIRIEVGIGDPHALPLHIFDL